MVSLERGSVDLWAERGRCDGRRDRPRDYNNARNAFVVGRTRGLKSLAFILEYTRDTRTGFQSSSFGDGLTDILHNLRHTSPSILCQYMYGWPYYEQI